MKARRPWPSLWAPIVTCFLFFAGNWTHGEEPAPGTLREIKFVGEDGEDCVIAFRWCPSGLMKEGSPENAEGLPVGQVEGFWLSETEVSQQHYRIIAGMEAMQAAKNYVLDNVAKPVTNKPSDELTENDRRAIEERELTEKSNFSDSTLPLYGIPPGEADSFCLRLSEAYDRFRSASGRRGGFSTFIFRLPTHYEWQYACRAESRKKHFTAWPDDPENTAVGEFKNFREYLEKKNPDLYAKHQEVLDSFGGSESDIVRLLEDPTIKDKAVRSYLEGLVQTILPVEKSLCRVTDESPTAWNIRGMSGNVSEWVVVVAKPLADRTDVPHPGDFAKGDVYACSAGGFNAPSSNVLWRNLSIWHWQSNKKYTSKTQDRVRGQITGIRIAMVEAVAETWFADLRQMADQAYNGTVAANELLGGFESGMEVIGRDREGQTIAGARVGIYGALAKARGGDLAEGSRMLQEAVAGLKDSGDDFFAQLEPLLGEGDLRN
jgi:formylglycine-generating enzyme required for sulfatase activity